MKKFFAIFKKDTILRFTSPMEWLFFLVLPIVFIYVISGGTGKARPSTADGGGSGEFKLSQRWLSWTVHAVRPVLWITTGNQRV